MTREELIHHIRYALDIGADITLTNEEGEEIIKALEQQPCEDAVSRQSLLKYINRIFNQGTGKKKSFEFFKKYVENLPPVTPKEKTKWIPVSERLPESDVDVLTQYSDYSMSVDSRTASSSGWFWADGKDDLPIAWMPLPEPYKAESEDKK